VSKANGGADVSDEMLTVISKKSNPPLPPSKRDSNAQKRHKKKSARFMKMNS